MRHPILQRVVSLALVLGTLASLLPFGHEALAEEQWNLWTAAMQSDDLSAPDAPAHASSPDGLARRDDPRPAFVPATMPAGTAGGSAAPLLGLVAGSDTQRASPVAPGVVERITLPRHHAAFGTSVAPRAP